MKQDGKKGNVLQRLCTNINLRGDQVLLPKQKLSNVAGKESFYGQKNQKQKKLSKWNIIGKIK